MINYDFLLDLKVKLDENEVTPNDLKKVVNGLCVYPINIEDSTLPSFKKMLKKIRVLAEERLEFSEQINSSVKEGFIAVIKAKENDIKACQIFFDRISKKEEKEESKDLFTIVRSYPASTNSSSSSVSSHSSVASLSNNNSVTSSSHLSTLSTHHSSSSNPALSRNDGFSIVHKSRDPALRNNPDALFAANIEDLQAVSTELASAPKLSEAIQDQIENSLDAFKIEDFKLYDDAKISALREQLGQLSEEFKNKPNNRLYSSFYHKRIIALCVELEAIIEAREEEKIKIAEIQKEREESLKSLCDVLKINNTTTSSNALISFQGMNLQDELEQIRRAIEEGLSKQILDLQLVDQAFLLVAQEYIQECNSHDLEQGYLQLKHIMVRLMNISTSNQRGADQKFLLEPAKLEEYQRKFNELIKRVPSALSSLKTEILIPTPAKPIKRNDFSSKKESLEKIVKELTPLSPARRNLGYELIEKFFMIAYSIDFETYSNDELETIKFNLAFVVEAAQTFKSSFDVTYAQNLIKVIVALQKTANRKVLEPKDENSLYLSQEYIDFLQSNIQNFDRLKNHEKMALYQALKDLCTIIASIIGEEGDLIRICLSQIADKILLISSNRDLDFIEAKIMNELFEINNITLPPIFNNLSLLSKEERMTLVEAAAARSSLDYKRKLFEDMKSAKMEARKGINKSKQELIRHFHGDKESSITLEWFIKKGYGSPTAEERAEISKFMNDFFKR